jgi:hypothetical protein
MQQRCRCRDASAEMVVYWLCRGADVVQCRGDELCRCRAGWCRCAQQVQVQVQRSEVQRCREVHLQMCRGDCAGAEQAGAELVQKSTRGDWAGAEVLQGWALVQRWCRLNAEMKRRC